MLRKIPSALVIVALLLGAVALVVRDDRAPQETTNGFVAEGPAISTTIQSPEQQVAFWTGRVDANPADYMSRASLGAATIALGKTTGDPVLYEQAEEVFWAALTLNPHYPAALLGLGAARAAQHDFATQLELAQRVYGADPANVSAYVAIADARLELGQYAEAAQIYEEVARREPSAALLSRLAKSAAFAGDPAGAVELARDALSAASDLELPADQAAYYYFQLATFAYRAGQMDQASRAVDKALEIDTGNLGALELAPRIKIAKNDVDGATALYEDLVARTPAADLHGELAKLYEVAGRTDDARRQAELGLQLGREQVGRFPAERRHLADFFGTHDPALALRLAEEDIATRRDVGAYDTLAWALYQNGRHEEAQQAARQALAVGIKDVPILFHAGMIEAELGDAEQARSLLGEALAINPAFDVVDAGIARAMLDRLS